MSASDLHRRFGPRALITGASDGIGRAFAVELAAAGFDLVLVARREAVLIDLARELESRHAIKTHVIAADCADQAAIQRVLAETRDLPIHLLVASAGFGSIGSFLDLDLANETNMIDVNCRSVVDLTHGIGLRLRAAGRGGVVLFGSIVGFQGVPGMATYAATKGFIQSFAEALAVEWRAHGISVLCVAPGPVGTGFAGRAGMHMAQADRPDAVARASLAALSRSGTVRPGFLGKALGWPLATLPRWARVRLLGLIMKGMRKPMSG